LQQRFIYLGGIIILMAFMLKKEDFNIFINILLKSYDCIAPVAAKGYSSFEKIEKPSDISLEKNTYYPPKKYLFPREETMFSYTRKKSILGGDKISTKASFESRKRVLIGVRMCDVSAIAMMDRFFDKDPYYMERRENTYIVALKCQGEEGENCFCSSFEHKDEGYDLFLERIEEGYIVDVKTKKGMSLVDKKLFKSSVREVNKEIPLCTMKLHSKLMKKDFSSESKKCLSCAACNVVCPTCTCFDIVDTPDPKSGNRKRVWDYCMSPDFAKTAQGGSPRDLNGRFSHRLRCKFEFNHKWHNLYTCTGCGRCVTACPTDVCDIPEMLNDKSI
jgi:sulfhydrogenase subunit beta (sulfur reductase)